jgi:hypothetical protein
MKASLDKNRLNISMPLFRVPKLSRSGKSLLVATSRGTRMTTFEINGKPIYVSASAFIRKRKTHHTKTSVRKK